MRPVAESNEVIETLRRISALVGQCGEINAPAGNILLATDVKAPLLHTGGPTPATPRPGTRPEGRGCQELCVNLGDGLAGT
jgi:hypothetical protein